MPNWYGIIHATVRNRGVHFKPGTDFEAVAMDVTDKFMQWRRSVGSKDISENMLISKIQSLIEEVEDRR